MAPLRKPSRRRRRAATTPRGLGSTSPPSSRAALARKAALTTSSPTLSVRERERFFLPSFGFFSALSSIFFAALSRLSNPQKKQENEKKTGKAAYVDVQGWHVYLSDVKVGGAPLSGILANELGPLAASQGGAKALPAAAVDEFLARVPLELGGGKATVSLLDAIPSFALGDLHRAVEDWTRNGGR